MKTGRTVIAVMATALTACAKARQPQFEWRNTNDPQCNYIGDSQERQLIANDLAAILFSNQPMFRLALNQGQSNPCNVGRNWRQLAIASCAASAPVPAPVHYENPDARSKALSPHNGSTIYVEAANLLRSSPAVLGVWVSYKSDTARAIVGHRGWKTQLRSDFDCTRRRSRVLSAAIYAEGASALVTQSNHAAAWQGGTPESFNEVLLFRVCSDLLPSLGALAHAK